MAITELVFTNSNLLDNVIQEIILLDKMKILAPDILSFL
jgi:hypothetical protein